MHDLKHGYEVEPHPKLSLNHETEAEAASDPCLLVVHTFPQISGFVYLSSFFFFEDFSYFEASKVRMVVHVCDISMNIGPWMSN